MKPILYFFCISTLCFPQLQAEPVSTGVAIGIAAITFVAGAIHQWWYYDANVTKNNKIQVEILTNVLNKQLEEDEVKKRTFQAEVNFLLCLRKHKPTNNQVPSACEQFAEWYVKLGGTQAYKNIMNNVEQTKG